MKRTYQPNKRKRAKCHGFRARMATKGGRAVLARRRAKGRKRLCVQQILLETITSSREISQAFSDGRRVHTRYLTLIVIPAKQHDHKGRVAFIAGKKLGNAVWRNSAKRRMREIAHSLQAPWVGVDVIFLAKGNITKASYSKVLQACEEVIQREGLFESEKNLGKSKTGSL